MSPAPPRPPSDDDPNIDKIKRDDEKPIEKIKPEKEAKLEQKEIEKVKSDKEHVEKFKFEKEHKEIEKVKADKEDVEKIKPEKEAKLEHKEIEKVKSDKEHVEKIKREKEKLEGKEFKAEAKIEVREKQVPEKLDKEVAEGVLPGEQVVDPAAGVDLAALHAQASALEQGSRQLRHFIERSMRPDLSEGALSNEADLAGEAPTEEGDG
ncbi:MAG: hypothetical protein QOJ35_2805 [Solirubrobacteraceae bacterium]|jgi:hypothetical protein|nr:hypothetical protein [Solirubrobacteraceae bacterium]